MQTIKTLPELRMRLGISQDTMSEYLGVNRSTYAMSEKGMRSLPADALTKLAKLEACFSFASKGKTKPMAIHEGVNKHQWHKLTTEWNYRIVGNTRSLLQLQKQLQNMCDLYAQASQWYAVIELIKADMTASKSPKREMLWLENQQAQVSGTILNYGPPAQQHLQVKINLLHAETAALQKALGEVEVE